MSALESWLNHARASCDMRVEPIRWDQSREWIVDDTSIRHTDGAFFSVVGARGETVAQPLIDQPEIGILGFLVRHGADGAEFCVQAKPEPGNVGLVQAAPTVQATESNYLRRHGGRATPLLDAFLEPDAVLSDSLQSEQGTRFLNKRNRNVIVEAKGSPLPPGAPLAWFPARELQALLLSDFRLNTDARSVLATGPWSLLAEGGEPFRSGGFGGRLRESYDARPPAAPFVERLEAMQDARTEIVGLDELNGWERTDDAILSEHFAVRPFAVTSSEREVPRWDQPLAMTPGEPDIVMLCQERGGVLRFLFRARGELGFDGRFEWGPAIQRDAERLGDVFPATDVVCAVRQSDEGGRFYRTVARYAIHVAPPALRIDETDDLAWLTLGQIEELVPRPGVFTNEARTLVSLLLGYA